jgi:hypothetical protein
MASFIKSDLESCGRRAASDEAAFLNPPTVFIQPKIDQASAIQREGGLIKRALHIHARRTAEMLTQIKISGLYCLSQHSPTYSSPLFLGLLHCKVHDSQR